MKTLLRTGLLLGSLAFASAAFAAADSSKVIDVKQVKDAIAQKHAGWKAKENWVSQLSTDELKKMLGLPIAPTGHLDFESYHSDASKYPATVDWRNQNGVNWLGPVMNQGNCGSCVAFATVATLEARVSIANGATWLHPTFSPQALFACGGGQCNYGWMPDQAARYLQRTGIPDEACLPYTSGSTGEDVACSAKCGDAAARSTKIIRSSMPTSYGGSIDDVKAALQRGPLHTTLTVYGDFVTYSSGVYKHVTGPWMGGHAVSLVGYDDAKRAWLIRNSWGQEWGENGFAWISWDDESGVGSDTWDYEVGTMNGAVSVSSPSDREFVSGTYRLEAQGQGLKAQDIQFHLKDSSGRELSAFACSTMTAQGCNTQVDTTQLKEGRYEIYAESPASGVKSQTREFFVINSEPKMTITMSPDRGVDLTKPLKDRPEFVIKAVSSPVPMQHIEFRAIDSNGKIAAIKSNDYVIENMKMGWRTMTVPNGRYTILFHGETKYQGKTYAVDSNSYSITVQN